MLTQPEVPMFDDEWFCGRSVDEPCEQRYAPHRVVAVAVMVVLALAFLVGCASAPKDDEPYLQVTCAVVGTGAAQFEGSPQRFPSLKMVCEKGI